MTLLQQGLGRFLAPAPLDVCIVKARLKVDRRVLIGVAGKPTRLAAKRLLRRAVVFRHMITQRAALRRVGCPDRAGRLPILAGLALALLACQGFPVVVGQRDGQIERLPALQGADPQPVIEGAGRLGLADTRAVAGRSMRLGAGEAETVATKQEPFSGFCS
jgi:hypothetical protein